MTVTGGRNGPECMAGINRNRWPGSSGICNDFDLADLFLVFLHVLSQESHHHLQVGGCKLRLPLSGCAVQDLGENIRYP